MKNITCVVIPHYNNFEGLCKSINSIIHPVRINVLIVDDGSNHVFKISELNAFIQQNVIVDVIYLNVNHGIEYALNKGLEYCIENEFTYVARLDCGDICTEDRFIKQEEFLNRNTHIGILGSWVTFFWNGKTEFQLKLPESNKKIARYKYLNSPFSHPAIMIRVELLLQIGLYSYEYHRAEDYELYFRLLKITQGANLPEFLTLSELNPDGISLKNRYKQLSIRLKIQLTYFNCFSIYSYYGIVRTLILLRMPFRLIKKLKKVFF